MRSGGHDGEATTRRRPRLAGLANPASSIAFDHPPYTVTTVTWHGHHSPDLCQSFDVGVRPYSRTHRRIACLIFSRVHLDGYFLRLGGATGASVGRPPGIVCSALERASLSSARTLATNTSSAGSAGANVRILWTASAYVLTGR